MKTSSIGEVVHVKTLQGSKCERCGYVNFPAVNVCPKCGPKYTSAVKVANLPTVGTVVTWTRLKVAPTGFPSPLLHCVLDLGNVKILGTLQGTDEINIGDKLVIVEDPSGRFPFVFSRSSAGGQVANFESEQTNPSAVLV
jgi:uncharacterized OB-fold protein